MPTATKPKVLILGAGFGGLEAASTLSNAMGDDLDITLIDRDESFVFGFAKLDVMFGKALPKDVKNPYTKIRHAGVTFVNATITRIDPASRVVTTDVGEFDADAIVIALGADLAPDATPGLLDNGDEFYSVSGVERLRETLPKFNGGNIVIGVSGSPFKCPPAPSEAALMLDSYLRHRGSRDTATITLAMPLPIPIPPSPDASKSILERFQQRDIAFVPHTQVVGLDPGMAHLAGGGSLPFDLYLGVPIHRPPAVLVEAGFSEDGWIPVDSRTMATAFPNVFAVGDCASVGTPKAGVFAERQAKAVAENLIAQFRGAEPVSRYDGWGTCYIEFGDEGVARVDVHFLEGTPTGQLQAPSPQLTAEKQSFGPTRIARWFDA